MYLCKEKRWRLKAPSQRPASEKKTGAPFSKKIKLPKQLNACNSVTSFQKRKKNLQVELRKHSKFHLYILEIKLHTTTTPSSLVLNYC